MLKISILSAALITLGCGISQTSDFAPPVSINSGKSANAERKPVEACNFDLIEKLETFYSAAPDRFRDAEADSQFLKELKTCPREQTINSIVALQKARREDGEIQAKTAYLLIKLDRDKKVNQKALFSVFPAYRDKTGGRFRRDHILDLIGDVVINEDTGEKTFLADAFDLAPLVNAATAEMLSGILAGEFEKNPEIFLLSLKNKSKAVKREVYSFISYQLPKDVLSKHLSSIPQTSDAYRTGKEMSEFTENGKRVSG